MAVSQQTILPACGVSIAGPALTAENASADVLASYAAIHYAEAGDILVAGFLGFVATRLRRAASSRVWAARAATCWKTKTPHRTGSATMRGTV